MPHQIIEYSANLESRLDIAGLVDHLHAVAAAQEVLPLAGLRTRAYVAQHFAIADKHPDNAFIAVYLRIGEGRTAAVKTELGETLRQALGDYVADDFSQNPLALSYEVQEIDTAMRWNQNNLRDHLSARTPTRTPPRTPPRTPKGAQS